MGKIIIDSGGDGYRVIGKPSPHMKNCPLPNPEALKTSLDRDDDYAEKQYNKGLLYGNEAEYVYITPTGTWAVKTVDGGFISSYEVLGYHRSTRELLKGFIDSGAKIVSYWNFPQININ